MSGDITYLLISLYAKFYLKQIRFFVNCVKDSFEDSGKKWYLLSFFSSEEHKFIYLELEKSVWLRGCIFCKRQAARKRLEEGVAKLQIKYSYLDSCLQQGNNKKFVPWYS